MNLRSFKFNRVYLDPRNMSNAGDFSWSWILKGFYSGSKRGRKICRGMFTPSIKRQIRTFHVVVVHWTSKKCTKKRDARAELLFWSLNLLFFRSLRCGRRRGCLSSLMFLLVDVLPRPFPIGQVNFKSYLPSSYFSRITRLDNVFLEHCPYLKRFYSWRRAKPIASKLYRGCVLPSTSVCSSWY